MRIKICGITQIEQAKQIVALGATALGFICVPKSPRYIKPKEIKEIIQQLEPGTNTIGVFADENISTIKDVAIETGLTGVQLHGNESPEYIIELAKVLPNNIEIIKALRIKTTESLKLVDNYVDLVDTLLLDAYHPQLLGGTGKIINWDSLQQFSPPLPWILAGGLTPDNIELALSKLEPDGIDLSSGVEVSPGNKDLEKVDRLFFVVKNFI